MCVCTHTCGCMRVFLCLCVRVFVHFTLWGFVFFFFKLRFSYSKAHQITVRAVSLYYNKGIISSGRGEK